MNRGCLCDSLPNMRSAKLVATNLANRVANLPHRRWQQGSAFDMRLAWALRTARKLPAMGATSCVGRNTETVRNSETFFYSVCRGEHQRKWTHKARTEQLLSRPIENQVYQQPDPHH